MNSSATKRRAFPTVGLTFASIAISLVSWVYPRIGFLKFSEVFALFATPLLLKRTVAMRLFVQCYWPFICATVFSMCMALPAIGHGDNTLTSDKGIYSSPVSMPIITGIHILVYLVVVAVMTQYFSIASREQTLKTLDWAYYLTIGPGLLQIFRIYSHIHFNLPFERGGLGPFSGVYDSGYLRLMGFETEPLAYATSLIIVCCLRMHSGRRTPWLGMVVLIHTFGAGAILGGVMALLISRSRKLTRIIVPLYTVAFVALCWYVETNISMLLSLFQLSLSVSERLNALYACVTMWLDHPMGVGLGLYGYFFDSYSASSLFLTDHLDWYPNNDPAMFLTYGGPIYLIAYLYTFHFVLRHSRSYWVLVAAMAIFFQAVSSYLFLNPAIILVFSLLLSQAEAIPKTVRVSKPQLLTIGPLKTFPFGIRFRVRRGASARRSASLS